MIAITGGIGAGKSYVARALERENGVRVYDCDAAAKRLMATDRAMQEALSTLVGEDLWASGALDKRRLAAFITASEANAQAVDDIVHPAVARDALLSGCTWLESAILFESGFFRRIPLKAVVCVTAPLAQRVERVMLRDGLSREQALAWIARQMPQEEKVKLSTIAIENNGKDPINLRQAWALQNG